MTRKETLVDRCFQFVEKRFQTISTTISSNSAALQSETKSSAGDKHETGRAMLQLEMEKAGQQLKNITAMRSTLARIDAAKETQQVCLGSIVTTNKGSYFISISAGKLMVENQTYFAVSSVSPIGKLLLGASAGTSFNFKEDRWEILEVQ